MVKFTDAAFGAKLLEAITAGLYDGNLNCLREYVQNSIDANAKRIDIDFENNQTVLVIKDNGCGMNKKKLTEALYLGKSEKSASAVGWRGIGIWSGVPACRRIVIITRAKNHPKLRVQVDANRLRDQYNRNILATKVLTDVTGEIEELEKGKEESNASFTVVRLEEILPNQRSIFRENDIRRYLSRNVPAPFNTKDQFKLGKEINKRLLENCVKIREPPIFFENQQIYRPPYSDEIFFDQIIDKRFVIKGKIVAYGWLLSGRSNKKLEKTNRGVYFKKKGFTIGDENLVANLCKVNYNQWQYGEIHIIADELRENAARNNFEANNEIVDPLYEQVGEFVGQLQEMNHYQSQNIVTSSIPQIHKMIAKDELKPALNKVEHLEMRMQQKRSFPKEEALQPMKGVIDKESVANKTSLEEIKKTIQNRIKEQPSNIFKDKTIRFNEFIRTSHPALKKHLDKTTKKGKLEFDINAMNPVKELLQLKTGLTTVSEISDLSRKAFGWKDIPKVDNPLLLLSDGKYRDRLFGAMIVALNELFVNTSKHEKGEATFAFYETMTKDDKFSILTDFHATQDLILRLIEKSKTVT